MRKAYIQTLVLFLVVAFNVNEIIAMHLQGRRVEPAQKSVGSAMEKDFEDDSIPEVHFDSILTHIVPRSGGYGGVGRNGCSRGSVFESTDELQVQLGNLKINLRSLAQHNIEKDLEANVAVKQRFTPEQSGEVSSQMGVVVVDPQTQTVFRGVMPGNPFLHEAEWRARKGGLHLYACVEHSGNSRKVVNLFPGFRDDAHSIFHEAHTESHSESHTGTAHAEAHSATTHREASNNKDNELVIDDDANHKQGSGEELSVAAEKSNQIECSDGSCKQEECSSGDCKREDNASHDQTHILVQKGDRSATAALASDITTNVLFDDSKKHSSKNKSSKKTKNKSNSKKKQLQHKKSTDAAVTDDSKAVSSGNKDDANKAAEDSKAPEQLQQQQQQQHTVDNDTQESKTILDSDNNIKDSNEKDKQNDNNSSDNNNNNSNLDDESDSENESVHQERKKQMEFCGRHPEAARCIMNQFVQSHSTSKSRKRQAKHHTLEQNQDKSNSNDSSQSWWEQLTGMVDTLEHRVFDSDKSKEIHNKLKRHQERKRAHATPKHHKKRKSDAHHLGSL